jgi:ATP-binding cassette, subfamily A (ABC1), member 3
VGKPNTDAYDEYTQKGYAILHNWLANFALRRMFPWTYGGYLPTISHLAVPMSSDAYVEDNFSQVLNILSFFMFLMFIVPLYRLVYRIVNEKETRARESMKMMGLTDMSYWLSWLTYYCCVITVIAIISTQQLNGLLKS